MDPSSCLFCTNSRSGGRAGDWFAGSLRRRFGEDTVVDLDATVPAGVVERLAGRAGVVACGGDGTATWILGLLEDLSAAERPPLEVMPLGTGNDLSRSLGWGPWLARSDRSLDRWLARLAGATPVRQDAWCLVAPDGFHRWYNYWSCGEDAALAREFDRLRRRHPVLFRGAWSNKLIYGAIALGTRPLLLRHHLRTAGFDLPPWARCVIASNIGSYAGGSRLDRRIDPADGLLDLHLLGDRGAQALALAGLRRPRCRARRTTYRFRVSAPVAMQFDGEAFLGAPGDYEIRRRGSVVLLRAG